MKEISISNLAKSLSPSTIQRKTRETLDRLCYQSRIVQRSFPFRKDKTIELLILSSTGNSHGLSFPFHYYRKDLRKRFNLEIQELTSDDFQKKRQALESFRGEMVIISMPLRFDNGAIIPKQTILKFFKSLPKRKKVKIVFFDTSDNPIGRHFDIAPYVDLYAMPFTFSDKDNYEKQYRGGNLFGDYMSHQYDIAPTKENEYHPDFFESKLAKDQQYKLFSIWNWMLYSRMIKLLKTQKMKCIDQENRPIDVHCRFHPYSGWCQTHRLNVLNKLNNLSNKYRTVTKDKKISLKSYYSELESSKILFSPFGWGEICPKDFEAIIKGCLLMKPSVEHIVANPNLHIPFKTYVPVAWDLSDLDEKIEYYLNHENERKQIQKNAAIAYENFFSNKEFLNIIEKMLHSLNLINRT